MGGQEAESLRVLTDSARLIGGYVCGVTRSRRPILHLKVFGMDIFQRATNLFQPALDGPVDPNYRLGPGDELVLILTGDVGAGARPGGFAGRIHRDSARWGSST